MRTRCEINARAISVGAALPLPWWNFQRDRDLSSRCVRTICTGNALNASTA